VAIEIAVQIDIIDWADGLKTKAWSSGVRNGFIVCGAGGLYPSDECGRTVL
jgi:hypothetical protein